MDRPEVPTRLFTAEEVNELLPQVRRALREIDRLRAQNHRVRGRLTELEAQWGEEILRPDTPDYGTYEGLQEEFEDAYKAVRKWVRGVHELGGTSRAWRRGWWTSTVNGTAAWSSSAGNGANPAWSGTTISRRALPAGNGWTRRKRRRGAPSWVEFRGRRTA